MAYKIERTTLERALAGLAPRAIEQVVRQMGGEAEMRGVGGSRDKGVDLLLPVRVGRTD